MSKRIFNKFLAFILLTSPVIANAQVTQVIVNSADRKKILAATAATSIVTGIGAYKYPCLTLSAYVGVFMASVGAGYLTFVKKINLLEAEIKNLKANGAGHEEIHLLEKELEETKYFAWCLIPVGVPSTCLLLGVAAHKLMQN